MYITSADELKRGMFLLMNNQIYQINRKEVVVVGTHSHSKTKIFCQPILGGGERNFLFAHKDKVEVPDVDKRVGQIIETAEEMMTVMDKQSYETLDIEADHSIVAEANEGDEVFFYTFLGKSVAMKMAKD